MLKQNSLLKDVVPIVKVLMLMVLIIGIIIARNIYLILFITTISLIIFIKSDITFRQYLNSLKAVMFTLIIFLVAYLFAVSEYKISNIILFEYKILLALFIIKTFKANFNFGEMHHAIYTIIFPLKITNLNIQKLSLNITLLLCFFNYFVNAKSEIIMLQRHNGIIKITFKEMFLPMLLRAINNLSKLKLNLKANYYKMHCSNFNIKSKIILLICLLFFAVCVLKEVIL